MTLSIRPALLAQLRLEEGTKLAAYPDPRSELFMSCKARGLDPYTQYREVPGWENVPAKPWTIGDGHTGPDVEPGLIWNQVQADRQLTADARTHADALEAALPWVANLDEVRQDVLIDMTFNLGVSGLLTFKPTLALIQGANYKEAAAHMRASLWAKQVGSRAVRLAAQMESGHR